MDLSLVDLTKILLAMVAGGLIGMEREFRDKAAGFRTLILISVGACLFTMFSARFSPTGDPARIAANIVTGIGFLGAGVILKAGDRGLGLTTASTIWLTASLGMGIGAGFYGLVGAAALLTMIVLWFFPRIEHAIDNFREERTYEVVLPIDAEKVASLEQGFREAGLYVRSHRQVKALDAIKVTWQATGSIKAHEHLVHRLISDPAVKEFRY